MLPESQRLCVSQIKALKKKQKEQQVTNNPQVTTEIGPKISVAKQCGGCKLRLHWSAKAIPPHLNCHC